MLRNIVLVILNVALSVVLALSVLPVVIVAIPAVRSEPAAGYGALGLLTAVFIAMNAALWRRWRR